MGGRRVVAAMRAVALAFILLLASCGVALADLQQSSGPLFGLPYGPQESCTIVQTTPVSAATPEQCDATGIHVQGVVVLVVRLVGEGHVKAYADQMTTPTLALQQGPVECRATATSGGACVARFPFAYSSGTFNLHVFVDGPGHAVAEGSLEPLDLTLP